MKLHDYSAEQAAQRTGISKAALRYYEKNDIIGPISRDDHGYRRYTEDDLYWIKVIILIREIGIPVKSLVGIRNTSMQERVNYLIDYRKTIQNEIKRLENTDKFLEEKITYLTVNKL